MRCFDFGKKYNSTFSKKSVTPYLNIIICHSAPILERLSKFGLSINDLGQQGFEATHKYHKRIKERTTTACRSTLEQTMLYHYRLLMLELHTQYNHNMLNLESVAPAPLRLYQ